MIGSQVSHPGDMGRTVSDALGCAPEDEFDPSLDDFKAKERSYTHFDLQLSLEDRDGFCVSRDEVARHSFWPLLGFVAEERRVKKDGSGKLIFEAKEREIKFGSHKDAAILEWYSRHLSAAYERYLENN
ncbi:MAG: hypothetical protein EON58_20025, partial [Alphaproteobacteria bacterium]